MSVLKQYYIDVFKLSNSTHSYEFEVESTFFGSFDNSPVNKGKAEVKVVLEKSTTFIDMQFSINGSIELTCDRSLEKFSETISSNHHMLFKYGDSWEEMSDEIVVMPRDVQRIDIGQYIYEFICLDVPMKKVHPKYRNEENEGVIYSSKNDNKEEPNSIWDKLKEIK